MTSPQTDLRLELLGRIEPAARDEVAVVAPPPEDSAAAWLLTLVLAAGVLVAALFFCAAAAAGEHVPLWHESAGLSGGVPCGTPQMTSDFRFSSLSGAALWTTGQLVAAGARKGSGRSFLRGDGGRNNR